MKLKCNGEAIIPTTVEIYPNEFLDSLLNQIIGFKDMNSLEIRDDGYLYSCFDISYHGSPTWEYSLVTKDKDKIELYEAICELKRCLGKVD